MYGFKGIIKKIVSLINSYLRDSWEIQKSQISNHSIIYQGSYIILFIMRTLCTTHANDYK